jgi:hypothetical protein
MSGSNVVAIRWNTTDPNALERNWEISNNIDGQGALSFRTGATQGADPTTTRMVIDYSGNLGLGVTPATYTGSGVLGINVAQTGNGVLGNSSNIWVSNNVSFNSGFKYARTTTATLYNQSAGSHVWSNAVSGTAGNAITFVDAMTLDASGNLGVGTTTQVSKISASGSSATDFKALTLRNSNGTVGSAAVLNFEASAGTEGDAGSTAAQIKGIREGAGTNGALAFWTSLAGASAERMRIDSSGNLLVGSTSYAYPFVVSRTTTNSRVGYLRADTSSYTDSILILDTTTTAGTSCRFIEGYSGSLQFRVYNNGNVQNTNNSYGSISDAKIKENIIDATPKLADLMQVKVRNYNLIGDTTKQIGVVAQELETVFPAMVDESPDRDMEGNDLGTTTKAVKYSVFVPMLIKAIQEQQALIQDLTTRLAALEAK